MKINWKEKIRRHQDEYWKEMGQEAIFSFEFYVSTVKLTDEILNWMPDPEGKMRIRMKFNDFPCVDLKGSYEDKTYNPTRESLISKKTGKATLFSQSLMTLEDDENRTFNPPHCMRNNQFLGNCKTITNEAQYMQDEQFQDAMYTCHFTSDSEYEDAEDCINVEEQWKYQQNKDIIDAASHVATAGCDFKEKSMPFNYGHTLIFNQSPAEVIAGLASAPMRLHLYVPEKGSIGTCFVPLQQFSQVIGISLNSAKNLPISGIYEEEFHILSNNVEVGTLHLDLRLTCFGSLFVHPIDLPDNKNDKCGKWESGHAPKLVNLGIREHPCTRIEKILADENVSKKIYSPLMKNTTIVPPFVVTDDIFENNDSCDETSDVDLEKEERPKGFHYKCIDWETVFNRRTLIDLIKTERGPFRKGSPYRSLICREYLAKHNLTMYDDDKYLVCGPGNKILNTHMKNTKFIGCNEQNRFDRNWNNENLKLDCGVKQNLTCMDKKNGMDSSSNANLNSTEDCPCNRGLFRSSLIRKPLGYSARIDFEMNLQEQFDDCVNKFSSNKFTRQTPVLTPRTSRNPVQHYYGETTYANKKDQYPNSSPEPKDLQTKFQKMFDDCVNGKKTQLADCGNCRQSKACPCSISNTTMPSYYYGEKPKDYTENIKKQFDFYTNPKRNQSQKETPKIQTGKPSAGLRISKEEYVKLVNSILCAETNGILQYMTYMEMYPYLPKLIQLVKTMDDITNSMGVKQIPNRFIPYIGFLPYLGVLLIIHDLKLAAEDQNLLQRYQQTSQYITTNQGNNNLFYTHLHFQNTWNWNQLLGIIRQNQVNFPYFMEKNRLCHSLPPQLIELEAREMDMIKRWKMILSFAKNQVLPQLTNQTIKCTNSLDPCQWNNVQPLSYFINIWNVFLDYIKNVKQPVLIQTYAPDYCN